MRLLWEVAAAAVRVILTWQRFLTFMERWREGSLHREGRGTDAL
jgi:hypothetical protein